MEPLPFQIVFEGKLKEKVDPRIAAEKLAQAFRLKPESVKALLSGRPIVIKRGLTRELAEKYKAALDGIGFECRIEQEPASKIDLTMEEAKSGTAVVPSCPKCGHQFGADAASDECPKCGVIIPKYIARQRAN